MATSVRRPVATQLAISRHFFLDPCHDRIDNGEDKLKSTRRLIDTYSFPIWKQWKILIFNIIHHIDDENDQWIVSEGFFKIYYWWRNSLLI